MHELTAGAEDPLAAFVDWYCLAEHRDDPATGCGVVALGADVPARRRVAQAAYRAQVERYLAHLEQLLGGGEDARAVARRSRSARMVGAVLIARALGHDPALGRDPARRARGRARAPARLRTPNGAIRDRPGDAPVISSVRAA